MCSWQHMYMYSDTTYSNICTELVHLLGHEQLGEWFSDHKRECWEERGCQGTRPNSCDHAQHIVILEINT